VLFSGGFVPLKHSAAVLLFSESPTRFLLEIRPRDLRLILSIFQGLAMDVIGSVALDPRLLVLDIRSSNAFIDAPLSALKDAWQAPLRW
jgi:phosphoribosylformylglycinamidine synthase